MDDIYVIVSGEYSDWSIVGYCNNEEEAAKRCFLNNTPEETSYYDEWYYLPVKRMEGIDLSNVHPDYYYEARAFKYSNGWEFPLSIGVELTEPRSFGVFIFNKDSPRCRYEQSAQIRFKSKELNREKALKIAQDMLYKKLAELDNL